MNTYAFEDLRDDFEDGPDWYAAWQEARQHLSRQFGKRGFGVQMIGRLAWTGLTAQQRAEALDQLFTRYYLDIAEEEREERLNLAAQSATSYADGSDISALNDALSGADLTDGFAEVDVNAQALSHVLAELELLQHRLAMRTNTEENTVRNYPQPDGTDPTEGQKTKG